MSAAGSDEPGHAATEDGFVACRVFGRGPHDLPVIGNWASNIDRLGRSARVICFDKRGAGVPGTWSVFEVAGLS